MSSMLSFMESNAHPSQAQHHHQDGRASQRKLMAPVTKWRSKALVAIVCFALFVVSSCPDAISVAQAAPAWTVIPGHMLPLLRNVRPTGSLANSTVLHLDVGLQLRDRATLNQVIHAQATPQSPWFHHYLTAAQFSARFGPTQATLAKVLNYLRTQGFTITSVAGNNALISATATASQVEHAFRVQLDTYQLSGRQVYAPLSDPSVPSTLAGVILAINGLNNVSLPHPQVLFRTQAPAVARRRTQASLPHDPGQCTGLNFAGVGYTPAELATIYDAQPLLNAGDNGSSETAAIVSTAGYNLSDLQVYQTCALGQAVSVTPILVDGRGSSNPTSAEGADETELDSEILAAAAPGAAQLIYIGNDLVQDLSRIVNDDRVQVVTDSIGGGCEPGLGNAFLQSADNVFAQGVAEGMAFFAASGDNGAFACFGENPPSGFNAQCNLALNWPADDPYVTSVGGTRVETNPDGSYNVEIAWDISEETVCQGAFQLGGGGGMSGSGMPGGSGFGRPWYQQGLTPPIPSDASSRGANFTGRYVPDVAADADTEYSPYATYCTVPPQFVGDFTGCGGIIPGGGTSAAAPFWAGVVLDVDQYLTRNGEPSLGGETAASLYSIQYLYAPAFHDVASGDNGYFSASGAAYGSEYDLATGLGSPDVYQLAIGAYNSFAESDLFWGANNGSSVEMLNEQRQFIGSPQQPIITDLSALIRSQGTSVPSLQANKGKPGVVSYVGTLGQDVVGAFALETTGEIGEFSHDGSSGQWSHVTIGTSVGQPYYNPTAVTVGSGSSLFIGLFGITSAGHLIEYFHNGAPGTSWNAVDLSQQLGVACDPKIAPAVTEFPENPSITEVFASCSQKLTQFFYSNGWHVNQTFHGGTALSIPNASEAFPGHSIAAVIANGPTPSMEVYIASDKNGVNALTEANYTLSGGWQQFTLPGSGLVADQVSAATGLTSDGYAMSEVFVTEPATSTSHTPHTVQYVYQPANPSWQITGTPAGAVTDVETLATYGGVPFTQAVTGDYLSSGGPNPANASIAVQGSSLVAGAAQLWFKQLVFVGVSYYGDNSGVDPAGLIFRY